VRSQGPATERRRRVIEVARASPDDLDALARLARETYAAAFGGSMEPVDLAAHLDRHLSRAAVARMLAVDDFLLARHHGSILGFVQFGQAGNYEGASYRPPPGAVEIRRLYVRDTVQNQGIGTRLMEAALDCIASRGSPVVVLDVWEYNPGARRFYERHGFVACGTRPFLVESGRSTGVDLILVRDPGARARPQSRS
jgi:diamine N-acetyltransferase